MDLLKKTPDNSKNPWIKRTENPWLLLFYIKLVFYVIHINQKRFLAIDNNPRDGSLAISFDFFP